MKRTGEKIVAVVVWDTQMAAIADRAGVFQSPGFLDERCSELFRQLGAGLGL